MHLNISKKTKIVCTIGTASDNAEMVRKLYDAGMTVMRINFSHGTYESAEAKIKLARDLEKEGILVPVALDTKGPEIRTGYMEGDKIDIPDGHIMRITMEEVLGTKEKFSVTYKGLYGDVKVGDHILIDDGNLDFEIIEKDEKAKELVVQAKNAHTLKNQKGVNCPFSRLSQEFISAKDEADLKFGCEHDVDCVFASFTRRPEDVAALKAILKKYGKPDIPVFAKIEDHRCRRWRHGRPRRPRRGNPARDGSRRAASHHHPLPRQGQTRHHGHPDARLDGHPPPSHQGGGH